MKLPVSIVIIIILWLICFLYLMKGNSSNVALANARATSPNQYQLLWPGILPDNKFYKVKLLRDKIMTYFIISPVKKVEYKLLLADKTYYAGELLFDKGEINEALITTAKGENYMSQLVNDYTSLKNNKKNIPSELKHRLILASEKHQEILEHMQKNVNSQNKKMILDILFYSNYNKETILKLNK